MTDIKTDRRRVKDKTHNFAMNSREARTIKKFCSCLSRAAMDHVVCSRKTRETGKREEKRGRKDRNVRFLCSRSNQRDGLVKADKTNFPPPWFSCIATVDRKSTFSSICNLFSSFFLPLDCLSVEPGIRSSRFLREQRGFSDRIRNILWRG